MADSLDLSVNRPNGLPENSAGKRSEPEDDFAGQLRKTLDKLKEEGYPVDF